MSTTCIDRAIVPAYTQAISILLKLAGPMFCRATVTDRLDQPHLHHWTTLRLVVNSFLEKRSRALTPELQARLIGALKACHELAHEQPGDFPMLDSERCSCETSSLLRKLAIVLTADAEARA